MCIRDSYEEKPVDLVVGLLRELLERNPGLDPELIDDVVLGCVTPIGDQGADLAKTAVIAAGYPNTVAGVQLNRFCASGLEAVNQAAVSYTHLDVYKRQTVPGVSVIVAASIAIANSSCNSSGK